MLIPFSAPQEVAEEKSEINELRYVLQPVKGRIFSFTTSGNIDKLIPKPFDSDKLAITVELSTAVKSKLFLLFKSFRFYE